VSELNLLGKKEKVNSAPGFSSVGQILKYYRELKGFSLEEVSKQTYIKLKYLQSLEENIVETMPAPVYVYSYIKHYSKLLGLEGGELVKLYQKQCNLVDSTNLENKEKIDKSDDAYLHNNNIVELDNRSINKDNGKSLMDLDAVFDNNIMAQPVQTESKASFKQEIAPMQKEFNLPSPDEKIITQEIIDAASEAERIILNAKREAERIIREAQAEAYQLKSGAQSYAESVLRGLEQELNVAIHEVRNGRSFLQTKQGE
jgi:transcriptional regulator with XRE-family HTH domain